MKKEKFNQKILLDKLGANIDDNKYKDSQKHLLELCNYNPFQTQKFIEVYMQAWCSKIANMINNKSFNEAGLRIRSFYMLITYNKSLNKLILVYFEKLKKENNLENLVNFNRTIHLSMESYYYYQQGKYDLAQKSALNCLEDLEKNFIKKINYDDCFLLIKKSLKNIRDKNKAEYILDRILLKVEKD